MLYAFLTNTIIINHHKQRKMDYNDTATTNPKKPTTRIGEKKFSGFEKLFFLFERWKRRDKKRNKEAFYRSLRKRS